MTDTARKIATQNDEFRSMIDKPILTLFKDMGRYFVTRGINTLPIDQQAEVVEKVRDYTDFHDGIDPYKTHEMGRFLLEENKQVILWKIDYYDTDYQWGSDDPSDLSKTRRVLTIMLSHEY